MAWIEVHDTLPDHDKVIQVSEELRLDKDAVVGKLIRLWHWTLQNRETGAFTRRDMETIAEVMRFKGKPERLFSALILARLLDDHEDGTYTIHGWYKRVGMLLEKREVIRAQDRERQRKKRDKDRDSNTCVTRDTERNNAVTVPIPYHIDTEDTTATTACAREPADVDNVDNLENVENVTLEQMQTTMERFHAGMLTGLTRDKLTLLSVYELITEYAQFFRGKDGANAKEIVTGLISDFGYDLVRKCIHEVGARAAPNIPGVPAVYIRKTCEHRIGA
jgi:hypothetical protein